MATIKEVLPELTFHREFAPALTSLATIWKFRTYVNILVVVDTEIATEPGIGFGIGSVIELIRSAAVGCMRFRIDIALRNGAAPSVVAAPAAFAPKYVGFRFDMKDGAVEVISRYQQIWCFGFKPSNSGNTSDAEIDQAFAFPASNPELASLAKWMDEHKGGLFGTGDHHFLGASMCRRIPRLGSMRRWTNADGVPPIGTPNRIDTLRPPSPAYEAGAPGGPLNLDNDAHQGDLKPQPIQWSAWQRFHWPFLWRKRPHPLLCHPTLGPIDVMPDHAHEGLCVETAAIDGAANYDFGTGVHPEYPPSTLGGPQPLPWIAAHGSTLADPPYNFTKGPQPARAAFPMISAYDGHVAGVGRVATDSTWHHWMDINIGDLKAANGPDWQKIRRYYINLAVWLNPPGYSTQCLWYAAVVSHFESPGFQEYQAKLPTGQLGAVLRAHLARIYGPCWVSEWIWWDLIAIRRLWPWETLRELKLPDRFGGLDPEPFENAYLGALVKASFDAAQKVKASISEGKANVKFDLPTPERLFEKAVRSAVDEVVEDMARDSEVRVKLLAGVR